jgi:hypothetical protein
MAYGATNSRRENRFFPRSVVRAKAPLWGKGNAFTMVECLFSKFAFFLVSLR